MRLTRTDIWNKFLRNLQSVGVTASSDPSLAADFNYQLGVYYQLMLAKLKDYKTYLSATFNVGMSVANLTSGTAPIAISSITSVGTAATVTTGSAHGYSSGNTVAISGCDPAGYNGAFVITVTSTTTFTYTLNASVSSVAAAYAQYYPNPQGFVSTDGITLSVGNLNYPLRLISSQLEWEKLNVVPNQVAVPPQFYFPRRDDFGIWPIPRNLYTGHIYYHYRDRNLSVDDYQAGTIALTQGSNVITGTSTVFTSAMVGRWLEVTDPTIQGQGYFNRISGYVSTTKLVLDTIWGGATASGISAYRIGETPEIPEDLHMYLPDGITGGYLKDMRKDLQNAQGFLNSFWTGDINNASRKEDDENVIGGLIGGMKAYSDREDERIVNRNPSFNPFAWEPWAVTIRD